MAKKIEPIIEKPREPIPITYDCGDFILIDKRALGQVGYFVEMSYRYNDNRQPEIFKKAVEEVTIILATGEVRVNHREWFDTSEEAIRAHTDKDLTRCEVERTRTLERFQD